MNLNHEYETTAWVKGTTGTHLIDVVATYELDGLEPLVYGIFEKADPENDVTDLIHPDEYDRIYEAISADVVGTLTDAADYAAGMER